MLARKYAHKIPFVVKINHNELMTYPNKYDQILFTSVRDAWNMGAIAVGATIYFGSAESDRQIIEIAKAFAKKKYVLYCGEDDDLYEVIKQAKYTKFEKYTSSTHNIVRIITDFLKE